MNIEISAIDHQKKQHSLTISINFRFIEMEFQFSQDEYRLELKEISNLIRDYNNNYTHDGIPIIDRDLFRKLELNKKTDIDRDLARIFAISSMFMHLEEQENFNDIIIYNSFIKEQSNNFLNDFNMIEWSGDLGPQSGIYFIKKEYVNKHHNAIKKFYNLGLLYRYYIEIENHQFKNYIFPFTAKNVKNYEILKFSNIWNQIIKDRNKELQIFIDGKRGNK